jgi:hypothetical protein
MKIPFWKKVKLFYSYRKSTKQSAFLLQNEANLRIDRVGRLYTVLALNAEDIQNYGPKLSSQIVQKYINDYILKVDKIFFQLGLNELVGLMEIKKIDELNYLVVFGYSLFNSAKVANWLVTIGIVSLLVASYFLFF